LSKRKFVIVCHDKVVRIPLEGEEILRVHDSIDVFPEDLSMTTATTSSSWSGLRCAMCFDVIMGMDWLSKRKFVIVCHQKVVEIPLEGSRKLRVQGERTLGAAKALMNAKVEFRIDLVHGATLVAKSPCRLAPLEMQELSEQL
ncbi:hypothetical protein Tco_0111590, partial [Tanacetum coccineum]